MIQLPKLCGEIVPASKAHIQRNLSHRIIRFLQKAFRFPESDPLHIFHKGHMEIFPEETAQIALAYGKVGCQRVQDDALGIIFLHKTYNFPDHFTLSRIGLHRLDFFLLKHDNIVNHLKKVSADKQLIALFLFIENKKVL